MVNTMSFFVIRRRFQNSARADDFDVQRDHVRLLRAAVARLTLVGCFTFPIISAVSVWTWMRLLRLRSVRKSAR